MHDLRRTSATLMARLGFSGDVIDACLNHAEENKVRRIYIVDRRIDQQREAFNDLGARLAEIVEQGTVPTPSASRSDS